MQLLATILTALVAIEHLYILYIEMFAWDTLGAKVFKDTLPQDLFPKTKGLAANQGLYNGFLSAGLGWTFLIAEAEWAFNIRVFFLCLVIVAATFGAVRSSRNILLKQGLPAIFALIATLVDYMQR
ncbi:MAG: DUF1304 domain-containing protein [Alloprevotella sp.]|nr:DUF1304 domain-containing protein [Alloprevotella sp.]